MLDPSQIGSLVARDKLAVKRTHLANERTALAFARTSLTFLVAGVSGLHLLDHPFWLAVSWVFIGLSPAIAAIGIWRFVCYRKAVLREEEEDTLLRK